MAAHIFMACFPLLKLYGEFSLLQLLTQYIPQTKTELLRLDIKTYVLGRYYVIITLKTSFFLHIQEFGTKQRHVMYLAYFQNSSSVLTKISYAALLVSCQQFRRNVLILFLTKIYFLKAQLSSFCINVCRKQEQVYGHSNI